MSSSSSESDAADSDSSYEKKLKRKIYRKRNKPVTLPEHASEEKEEQTKEGQNKYECKGCSKIFRSLTSRFVHTTKCQAYIKKKTELTCKWCDKPFPSKSALGLHAIEVHGDSSHTDVVEEPVILEKNTCICKKVFKANILLKYHIRRMHFNLVGKAPYAQEKKVNQVWFEKVHNSNNIIEIKKIKDNALVMKKISENTAIKVNSDNERIIDVTHIYPTGRLEPKVKCQYCNKSIIRNRYRAHYNEVHLNIRNHHCDICNKSFKRNYLLTQHPCYKAQKLKEAEKGGDDVDNKSGDDVNNKSVEEPSKD